MEIKKNKLSAKRVFVFKDMKTAKVKISKAETEPTNTMVTLTVTGLH